HLIVPATGLGESTFYEANANRGSQQLLVLVDRRSKKVSKQLKVAHLALGELVALDGSLIAASLSMRWAEYSSTQHKAKAHVGFDLNRGLPRQLALTEGNGAERPFVSTFLVPGETVVVDRGYLDYHLFDTWIDQGKHFVARLRKNAQREILEALPLPPNTNLFFFAKVRLGDAAHCMKHPLFLIGFNNRGKVYWIVTDREDLSAEQIAFIFALRWEIESFFAWWKKHLDVYHLISRNPHGVLLQLLAGLVTYLLLLLYCQQGYGEPPSLQRLRQLRRQIRREATIAYLTVHTRGIEPAFGWLSWILCCQNQANL
ncbi:MAG: IS4 family transposase, partial [Dehalococcoidia bacterium]|nr:IS4 family transposase [Dehalococcoidia bacterium]